MNYSLPCATWPVPATSKPGAVSAPNAAPLLILGTTGDPATPLSWAVGLSKQLQTSHLITMPGEQHTAYQQGNNCVDTAVNAYLLRGETPNANLTCRAA